MVVKKIQYHDFDGDLREDEFYFFMNETQYARVNRLFPGGLEDFALKAAKNKNNDDMFMVIDTLVRESYGEKVGNNYVKVAPNGQKLSDFFMNTEAYDNLFMELTNSEDSLINFMSGCLNENAKKRVNEELDKRRAEIKAEQQGLSANNGENKPSLSVLDGKVE